MHLLQHVSHGPLKRPSKQRTDANSCSDHSGNIRTLLVTLAKRGGGSAIRHVGTGPGYYRYLVNAYFRLGDAASQGAILDLFINHEAVAAYRRTYSWSADYRCKQYVLLIVQSMHGPSCTRTHAAFTWGHHSSPNAQDHTRNSSSVMWCLRSTKLTGRCSIIDAL